MNNENNNLNNQNINNQTVQNNMYNNQLNNQVQYSNNPSQQVNVQNNTDYSNTGNYVEQRVKKKSSGVIVIIIIVVLGVIFGVGRLALNLITLPISTKITMDNINEARLSRAKSTTLSYVDSIEYYIGFSQASSAGIDLGGYDVSMPTLSGSNVTCTTEDGTNWIGEVDEASSSCTDFMNAVNNKAKTGVPTEAKIIISSTGKVVDNSWIKTDNIYCTYANDNVTCDKNKPE